VLYRVLTRTGIALQIQYRASNVIWMLGGIIEPVIYLVVWSTVAREQGGSAGGWTPEDFAAYYVALMFVNHLTFAWVMHVFQFRIQQGELSFALLRPIHPIHSDIADNVAFKLVMLAVLVPAALVVAWAFDPRWAGGAAEAAAFVPALVLAFGVRFLVEWSLALAAFWTTRVTAVNNVYFTALIFLSGRVAPIDMLPGWLQTVSVSLPFHWMVAFPVEVLLGRVPPGELAAGLATQLGWIAAALLALSLLWTRAVRRFGAVGG
jgi:ABC-2 type transport system permease protein